MCLVVERACDRHPLLESVEAAVEAGVDWLQVRDRELEGAELLAWASDLCAAARRGARSRGVKIVLNRRVDVALAIGADGIHLGFDALGPEDAALLLKRGAEIGVSAHTPDEVAAARDAGATYAHLAPIWAPLSKAAERPALGIAALEAACRHGLPVLAQGGVSAQRCAAVLAAGASGVAVTGDILLADDPGRAAATLRAALTCYDGR